MSVTPEHLATAYSDSVARMTLQRARVARALQDSAVRSYEALGYQRMSLTVMTSPQSRERVLFRNEAALQTRWQRGIGATIEAKGARAAYPGASTDESNRDMRNHVSDLALLPYYPGQEQLWIENGLVQIGIDEEDLIHPLEAGAEAYYTFETGDSARVSLPDGNEVRVRELKIRPRRSAWNVIVGSLWFDLDRGNLTRAVYRLTESINVFVRTSDDVPAIMRLLASPKADVTAIVVEYGLFENRFWLRRLQSIQVTVRSNSLSAHATVEQSFRYSEVNADSNLSAVLKAFADSLETGSSCNTGTTQRSVHSYRYAPAIRMHVSVPCDYHALAKSADLPPSIFATDESLYAGSSDELASAALGLDAQPQWDIAATDFGYGMSMLRYNRIEGLSVGVGMTQQLGAGYAAEATVRFGLADRDPNVDLALARTNLSQSIRIGAYKRLVASNHWGDPLGFGSSVSALLWGRDDGFYFRATGIDVTATWGQRTSLKWRVFGEEQRNASVETSFSVARLVSGVDVPPNVIAMDGRWFGTSVQASRSLGTDPRNWRLFGDVMLETATGTTTYVRAGASATLSRALGSIGGRAPLAALTFAAGTAAGGVTPQRHWFLGGTHTVRGHDAGSMSGEAYWLGRAEIAHSFLHLAHLALFADIGWAGRASHLVSTSSDRSRAISGAGAGLGLLEGLIRLDVARGLHPATSWRTHLYLGARF